MNLKTSVIAFCFSLLLLNAFSQGFHGYYRYPDLHGNTIVFVAEGDLWKVDINGGAAVRLTTHPGEELFPKISPDGSTIAFTGSYEGSTQLYTMPIHGGVPVKWTFDPMSPRPNSWTSQGEVVYSTMQYSTLPEYQLVKIDPKTKKRTRVPLYQASEGSFDDSGTTVYFVRPADHRNVTKRYKGGTARKIWKYTEGTEEAIRLSDEYAGESHHPMWENGRVYFITDRDGTMNIWSMDEEGGDLQQHTKHKEMDVRYASIDNGRIVYHRGADLWMLDLATQKYEVVPVTIVSDLDQLREKWVENPQQYITNWDLHPEGEKVTVTARGRVFVFPAGDGRMVQVSRKEGVRYRDAVFSADGDNVIVLSDESGEFEFHSIPASGIGVHKPLSNDGQILRFKASPSPDKKWIAYSDLNNEGWILNLSSGEQVKVSTNQEGIGGFAWSPDSKWLAFSQSDKNLFSTIYIRNLNSGATTPITTNRANNSSPEWSPDGKFIYFLSDRNFQSIVGSPWGTRQPEPYFDKQNLIFHIPLQKDTRSPFQVDDELYSESEPKPEPEDNKTRKKGKSKGEESNTDDSGAVSIDLEGIVQRVMKVPVDPGNYSGLAVSEDAIYTLQSTTGIGAKTHLAAIKITNDDPKVKNIVKDVRGFQLSANRKKIGVRKGSSYYIINATASEVSDLNDHKVNMSGWKFSLDPVEDWKQIYTDAWRMERDYFYDPNMHGVDWDKMHDKYLPLVSRVTTREELSDVIGRMVGELSALHTSVWGGDLRDGPENIRLASLGASFTRVENGYRIDRIYRADPDYPSERAPLDHPQLNVNEGDVITHIDGESVLAQNHISALLRNKTGKQVRLSVTSGGQSRDLIVRPISNAYGIRYRDWEYERRRVVEKESDGNIGYVHLRAMGSRDISQWYREFYPAFNREGLIIDVRGNRGGNIESFILEKLLRRTWFYWKVRAGGPYRNMQYAFNGHIVVLIDARTASDGEAFAEGFRRLGLGKLIGVRTWGGEIWLSSSNRLSDNGLARAPMMGVYDTEGKEWLIEGHGVEPDIEVDNLPHATFNGKDAQLEKAIEYLQDLMAKEPRVVPDAPPFPDLSFGDNKKK